LDFPSLKIANVKWVSGGLGSTGVFFATTADGIFVAKPISARSAGEIYASLLAMRLDIPVPKMVVPQDSEHLRSKLAWAPFETITDKERLRNERVGFLSVIEYIDSQALPACAMRELAGPAKEEILRAIGRIMLLDILVNNFDRLPLCWNNDGNPDNILVRPAGAAARVVAIDHTLTCIKNADGRRRYVQQVQDALRELVSGASGPCTSRVRASLVNCTGYEIDAEGVGMLVAGMRDACRALATLALVEPNWAEAILEECLAVCGEAGAVAGAGDITTTFVSEMASVVLASDFASACR
jgi:hypothetical protein